MILDSIDLTSWESRSLAFVCGVVLHHAVFRRGDWDLYVKRLIVTVILLYAAGTATIAFYVPADIEHVDGNTKVTSRLKAASVTVGALMSAVFTGLFGSICVYRAFFHPLRHFPGPFAARLSNFYRTLRYLRSWRQDLEVQKLHQTYGDVVRVGPRELSINDPDALLAIHSSSTTCLKGPWYNLLAPAYNLLGEIRPAAHAERRKAWDRAFSSKALLDYKPRVARYTSQLLEQIGRRASKGEPVNVSDWVAFYTLDVMASLSYSESFRMLESGVMGYYMRSTQDAMVLIGVLSWVIWLIPVLRAIPVLNSADVRLWRFLIDRVEKRIALEEEGKLPDGPDIFSWILKDYREGPKRDWKTNINLYSDAFLITVAGSDTTAATIASLVFELCTHQDSLRKLQAEIDEFYSENRDGAKKVMGDGDDDDGSTAEYDGLHGLKYLQGCINEALRLHPAVPRGVQRMTPPEGLQAGKYFIPGDTIVQNPTHTMFRDERYFPDPDEFIPERWTTRRAELVKDERVFVPFSMGLNSCVGKQLALTEIRYVVSQVVRRWDFELVADGGGGEEGEGEGHIIHTKKAEDAFLSGKSENFTMIPGRLDVVFRPRTETS